MGAWATSAVHAPSRPPRQRGRGQRTPASAAAPRAGPGRRHRHDDAGNDRERQKPRRGRRPGGAARGPRPRPRRARSATPWSRRGTSSAELRRPMPVAATCPGCQSVVAPGSKFCGNCGASMAAAACPKCKTPLAPNTKFCGTAASRPGQSLSPPRSSSPLAAARAPCTASASCRNLPRAHWRAPGSSATSEAHIPTFASCLTAPPQWPGLVPAAGHQLLLPRRPPPLREPRSAGVPRLNGALFVANGVLLSRGGPRRPARRLAVCW